jgi:hypothetical protein
VVAADVDRDGDLDVLSASATDNKIAWHENAHVSGDGSVWTPHTIALDAVNARSVFAADLDADGDIDALAASATDNEVAWYENVDGDGASWSGHSISTEAGSPRSAFAADFDGDGDLDAVSASNTLNAVLWHRNGGGQFALPTTALAQRVVVDSQEEAALQIDFAHRGREGDSDVELVELELHFQSGGLDLTSAQANNLIEKLELFLDDGSGDFELPGDGAPIEVVDPLSLTAGVQSILLAGGGPSIEVEFGETKRYFLVFTMTSNAGAQTPDSFELTHLTQASSSARDQTTPVVILRLEHHPDTSTGLIDTDLTTASCQSPFELDLLGFQVSSTVVCEAGTVLTAGDGLTVNPTGDLTLRAGQRVRFVTDFSVQAGGELATEIDPSLEP